MTKAIVTAGFLALGFAAGALHFALLRWNVALFAARGALGRALALAALRLGVTGAVLLLAVLQGAWPLLLVAAGMVLARPAMLRVLR
jgi:hypothetical protein